MKSRTQRLKAIETIVADLRLYSQDELSRELEKQGFEVTQATLSRDLRLLRVNKVSDGEGYYYALPDSEEVTEEEYQQDFLRGYLSMDCSGNLVVIKVLPGHAGSVAWAIDNLELYGVLGTVAGDDTILVILKEGVHFGPFKTALKERIPGWEV